MEFRKKNILWFGITLLVIILDQTTKAIILHKLHYGQVIQILPLFNLTLVHNPGAAWNFLSNASGWQRWLFMFIAGIVSVLLIIWILRLKPHEKITACGLSLVLGGALGNLIDRINHGYVIDFIQVYYKNWYFPNFNVADSAITLGAFCIILSLIKEK